MGLAVDALVPLVVLDGLCGRWADRQTVSQNVSRKRKQANQGRAGAQLAPAAGGSGVAAEQLQDPFRALKGACLLGGSWFHMVLAVYDSARALRGLCCATRFGSRLPSALQAKENVL